MHIAQQGTVATNAIAGGISEPGGPAQRSPYVDYKIIRRNGAVVGFEPAKISVAMTKAYLAVGGSQGAGSARIRELVTRSSRETWCSSPRVSPTFTRTSVKSRSNSCVSSPIRKTNGSSPMFS